MDKTTISTQQTITHTHTHTYMSKILTRCAAMTCINISASSFKFCIFGGPFTQTSHLQKTSINACGRSKVWSSCKSMTYEMYKLQWLILAYLQLWLSGSKDKRNFEQRYTKSKLETGFKVKRNVTYMRHFLRSKVSPKYSTSFCARQFEVFIPYLRECEK